MLLEDVDIPQMLADNGLEAGSDLGACSWELHACLAYSPRAVNPPVRALGRVSTAGQHQLQCV